jgi:nucleotide-binding universal stress UspA family protein
MTFRNLLVHLDSGSRTAERLDVAALLATRFGARLVGLFAERQTLGTALATRRNREEVAVARDRARSLFEARLANASVVHDFWALEPDDDADLVNLLSVCCRYVDLAIFGQHQPGELRLPPELVETVLLDAGRPLLVVPSIGRYADLGQRVVIAWNSSRESARALNDAIPFLRLAKQVTVLAFQRPSEGTSSAQLPPLDIVAHLAAHGIRAQYERVIQAEAGFGDQLLSRSSDLAADLAVVGGSGRHGTLFLQAGSTTRESLRAMTMPVLLPH